MEARDEIARGEEAARILNSSVFNDAVKDIENAALKQLKKSPVKGPTATTEQQQLILLLQVSNMFVKLLQEVIDTGKLANQQLINEKKGMFR